MLWGTRPGKLPDETEIGSQRLDFIRAQRARNDGHWGANSRMISLAPLLKPRLEVEIGQAAKTRYLPYPLGVRTVAGITGRDVGFGNAIHVNRLALRHQTWIPVLGWLGRDCRKVSREISRCPEVKCCHRVPHILFREGTISCVVAEAPHLTLEIRRPLPRQSRRNHVSLARC